MSFLKLILTNPFRKKSISIISIVGIAIGIASIIALGGISEGMVASFEDSLSAGDADFSVVGKDTGNSAFGTNALNSSWIQKINNISEVNSSAGILMTYASSSTNAKEGLCGINPQDTKFFNLKIIQGKIFKNENDLVLGKTAADELNKTVGDKISLNQEEFTITGIAQTGDPNFDGAYFVSLDKAQKLSSQEDKISNIYVKVNKGTNISHITDNIENKYGNNLSTVSSVMDIETMADQINMLKGASWGISVLAIIIGGLGIINTMLMSVFERTQEIGVLKAVGWSKKRILIMIISESIVITIISGIIGSIFGIVIVQIISPMISINPIYSANTFIQAFIIAIFVGIIGGIYPALKASNLPPTEALKYE